MTAPAPKAWRRPWAWQDVNSSKQARKTFAPSKAAERAYAKQLRDVAGKVAQVLAANPDPAHAARQLSSYAEVLEPWARQAAANMVRRVAKKNDDSWREAANRWGIDLRGMLDADVEQTVQSRIEANVLLITSIPGQAAERVAELAQETLLSGSRADELAEKLGELGNVTKNRARVIALTEVSKAGVALTRARAESVGSDGYIWRTARDGQTRPSHRAMEGKFVRWDSPPTLDGMTGHAGEFPNCRCYPEPVVHDSAGEEAASPLPTSKEEEASGEHVLRSQWEQQETSTVVPHLEGEPLHNVDARVFDMRKLQGYVLDQAHDRGGNKARVLAGALGIGPEHADMLRDQIMALAPHLPATRHGETPVDEWGERFNVVIPVTGPNGKTVPVRTSWIYDRTDGRQSTRPRLITARAE